MRFSSRFFGYVISATLSCASAVSAGADSMLLDLQIVHSIFQYHYAPKEWKESLLGWDLEEEYRIAKTAVEENPSITVPEFQQIIHTFIRSSQDYHVACRFDDTESSSLLFSVKSVDGRYFVYSIDTKRLDTELIQIQIGDELLSIDGVPVDTVAQDLLKNIARGIPDTDQALVDPIVTQRTRDDCLTIPNGSALVKFRDKETGQIKAYEMLWHYEPEYVTYHKEIARTTDKPYVQPIMEAADWMTDLPVVGRGKLLGEKKSDISRLGKVLWKNDKDNIFHAYIFETPEGENVGFLRIPHFRSLSYDSEEEMEELVEIFTRFEEFTSKLVIDQTNNPGGKLFYLYDIVSLLAYEPIKLPKNKVLLSPTMIADYRMDLKDLENVYSNDTALKYLEGLYFGRKPSLQLIEMLKNYYKTMISEWESGKNLSDPVYLLGIESINRHPDVVYTKPVLVLVNELDISCGDFFPAIMQDNKRAVIMGNRTAGAGGCVMKKTFLNNEGIRLVGYTWTIAERIGTGLPIENLGVTPDVHYKTTTKDLQFGFKEYKAAILEQLKKM